VALIAALAVSAVVWNAKVDYTDSDSLGTLLVAESLLRHGTIDLAGYGPQVSRARYGKRIVTIDGATFYRFPLGSSLLAIPWVAAENALGVSMLEGERAAQMRLSAVLAAAVFLLGWQIARAYVGDPAALVIALLFSLGTPFASTLGSALWSHDFAVVLMMLAVRHLVRHDTAELEKLSPGSLALLLFSAYLCRPTASVFAACVLGCVALADRRTAATMALLLAGMLAAFSAFSWLEFGSWLPSYYEPQRLGFHPMLRAAIETNLFGPNRGIFVYSPFLLFSVIGLFWCGRRLWANRMMIVGGIFPVLHLLVISSLPKWWAGGAFGPRYMVDAIPGLFLTSAMVWREVVNRPLRRWTKATLAAGLALLGAFSIWVNSYQALYNRYTRWWNRFPGATPNAVLDWRYPQLLFDEVRFERAKHDIETYKKAAALAEIDFGRDVSFRDDARALFDGWSLPETDRRWSEERAPRIFVRLPSKAPGAGPYRLRLRAASLGQQRVTLAWEGRDLGEQRIDLREFGWIEWSVPAKALQLGRPNELALSLPDARRPSTSADPRLLAVALSSFAVGE